MDGMNESEGKLGQRLKVICKDEMPDGALEAFNGMLEDFAGYYGEAYGIDGLQELKVNIKESHKKGSRRAYEMKANLVTDKGISHAEKTGWKPIPVFKDLLQALKNSLRR